ncbi:MAG: S8 family serine peptidase [Nocardioidaceae bacterium]
MPKRRNIPVARGVWRGEEIAHRADRIIVKLAVNARRPDLARARSLAEELAAQVPEAEVARVSAALSTVHLEVPEGTDIPALAERIAALPGVEYACPDRVTSISATPSDTRYSEQWGFPKIHADAAWDTETGDTDVLLAVLDTGISWASGALTHPDLDDTGRYLLGTDFIGDDTVPEDGFGHGTHVAGTCAAESNNAQGVSGMNWVSQVYVCKVFDDSGFGSESDFQAAAEEAVDYAVANSKRLVINLSARWTTDSPPLRDACDYIDSHGMILCVATGNDHASTIPSPAMHSADFGGVIAVGATDSTDAVAGFSNTGPEVSVVAPGVEILSTFPTYDVNGDTAHDYVSWDGTSMATPHVAGLASLVWSHVAQLSNEQVRDVIQNTADKLGPGDFDNDWGHGRVNAAVALAKAGWQVTPVQLNLNFVDIPEGETQLRAIRLDVNSFHTTTFDMAALPTAPFSMHNFGGSVSLPRTTDYDTPRSVFLWVRYTGTTAGSTDSGSAQVRCTTTGQVWNVTITANTIARPTAAMMLALDQSGSMLSPSGVGTMTREQVLRYSAGIFMGYVREGNGVGMVTFDEDAHQLLNPVVGPFGPADDPFDPSRASAVAALATYAANPMGTTAIGDGIELAHNDLAAVTGYDKSAVVVFTDGHETDSKYIADVAGLIDSQVFAVGLGTADELNPAALRNICNGHGGYLLLTDQLDNDDTFKLAKYFLQIQAGVNNEDIVVDPDGFVAAGSQVVVPFRLNEADISVDTIVLMPFQGVLQVGLVTPAGDVIDAGNVASFPTVQKSDNPHMTYYRMTLPVDDGASVHAQEGEWQLVLTVDKRVLKKYLSSLDNQPGLIEEVKAHGVRFTALVHSFSNLRMRADVSQTSFEPGATLTVSADLFEYGQPFPQAAGSSSVQAVVTRPNGSQATLPMTPTGVGTYAVSLPATSPGIYRFVVSASGSTSRRTPFTREQVVTGAVWAGGDEPPPRTDDPGKGSCPDWCKPLRCFLDAMSPELRKRLEEQGWKLDELLKCVCS